MLTPLQQPNKETCGPTALAIATGLSVEETEKALGDIEGDEEILPPQMYDALQKLHILSSKPLQWDETKSFPKFGMLYLIGDTSAEGKWDHWLVIKDGLIYDPWTGQAVPKDVYLSTIVKEKSIIKQFIELYTDFKSMRIDHE